VIYPIKNCYEIAQVAKGFKNKTNDRVKYKVDVPFTNKKGKEEIADLEVSLIVEIKNPDLASLLGKVEQALKKVAKV
jgi:hypothetical protein